MDGCERRHAARGFCASHYATFHYRGMIDTNPRGFESRPRKKRDPEERFWEKVAKSDSCWTWTGAKLPAGYGLFGSSEWLDGEQLAHRIAYRLVHGEIEHTIDHLCRNRACVNPEHLEDVPLRENIARAWEHWRSESSAAAA